ncbi:hypothetical protein [Pelagicoccus sp. SDUM812005]|uniref:hypothetical protein n=1 Tax=Pelagicoccus sp. SDUM812005 TaxID=3041257 RepID=UPI00280DF1C3|nr:hypothetical protein [Pelagicoccus sp. SDUM812005]MDQ8182720.1 hypothetical protein [Pelagicoccus sp. SDUM812005]
MEFSDWIHWPKRNALNGIHHPGVYAIAISNRSINEKPFDYIPQIAYFGMTNSQGGLKSRLKAFENTIAGKTGHGGAQRFIFKHKDYDSLTPRLFVSIHPIDCDVNSKEPKDLRKMGDVAKLEYECFARFVERFGKLPEFNDMKLSPKK